MYVFFHYMQLYYLLVFFFFSFYANHQHLHSFPTRRSSDLKRCRSIRRQARRDPDHTAQYQGPRVRSCVSHRYGRRHLPAQRSEEHTSELQSRGHLVCRLLLEKKKKHFCVPSSAARHCTLSL